MTCEERRENYEIRVRGHLGPRLLRAFPVLAAQTLGTDTVLRGWLPDQAAVYGVIAKLEGLGLELLELRRLPS
jgi:epsilon-lactone hydrolase